MLLTSGREMAVGNTFGATALSSYGGFWLSFAVILTPGGFEIPASIEATGGPSAFYNSFGFFLMVIIYLFQLTLEHLLTYLQHRAGLSLRPSSC